MTYPTRLTAATQRSRIGYCQKHASARFALAIRAERHQSRRFRTSTKIKYERTNTNASDGSINRYYDPNIGQFLSVDPAVSITAQPYSYANDDPINEDDPLGLGCGIFYVVCNTATQAWNDTGGKAIHAIATHTIGLCLNLSAGWGAYGTASGCIALSGGRPTLIGTAGGGGASPMASATLGFLLSNAHKLSDLRGPFAGAGRSADLGLSVGDEGAVGTNSCNQTIWENQVTAGVGLDIPFVPFELHGDATYTWTWSP